MEEIFTPDKPFLAMFVRGTVVYLGLFVVLRIFRKRKSDNIIVTDLLLITLLADAVQNGLADEYKSVTCAAYAAGTIFFWCYALDWLALRWKWLQGLIEDQPVVLVKAGKRNRRAMRREAVTDAELMGAARQAGLTSLDQIKLAVLESDGEISVLPAD